MTDLTRRISPKLAKLSAGCRNANKQLQLECEEEAIDPGEPLFLEIQSGIDKCFVDCGYPARPKLPPLTTQ